MKIFSFIQAKSKTKFYVNEFENIAFTGYEDHLTEMIDPSLTWRDRMNPSNFRPRPEWKEVDKFWFGMTFLVTDYSRGNSSTNLHLLDVETDADYRLAPKGIAELMFAIQTEKIVIVPFEKEIKGKKFTKAFFGLFTVVKQGANYYLMPYIIESSKDEVKDA